MNSGVTAEWDQVQTVESFGKTLEQEERKSNALH